MLKYLRGKRFDVKTTLVVLVIAAAFWAVVVYANLMEFIPAEFRDAAADTLG